MPSSSQSVKSGASGKAVTARKHAAFVKKLAANEAALFWRQGHWHVVKRDGGPSICLPSSQTAIVDQLKTAGILIAHPDGALRLGAGQAQPRIDTSESPLARLSHLKDAAGVPFIDVEQFRAGERLREDFERAQLAPRMTVNYEPSGGSGGRHWQMSDNAIARLADNAIAAREHVHAALNAVGPELAGMLYQVCCLVAGLEQAERHLALPRRAGKAVLALALTRLARHYGLKPRLSHGGPARIGHWAIDGFRPQIPPAAPPRQP